MIADALSDTTSKTLVVLGEHGDERVELVTRAHQITPHLGNLVHVVGTTYAQNLRYGALAFLLADLETADEPGPPEVMKAISRRVSSGDGVGLVVLEYPQLLDVHSRTILAQMAFNHSIILVVLADLAGVLPAEFTQSCRAGEHHELRIGPLTLEEAHETLAKNFSAPPTPLALAALWRRSQGIPGWLTALAQDALANGKLVVREGHLVLGTGPWPRGGRLEAIAQSQMAVLQQSDRDLLSVVAHARTAMIQDFDSTELNTLDRLISWGFIRRRTNKREVVEVRSKLLADELRAGSGDYGDELPAAITVHGHVHDFLAGTSPLPPGLLEDDDEVRKVRNLLDGLRRNLLDGELDTARTHTRTLLLHHHLELPEELFEVVVFAQAILDVIGASPGTAQPALRSIRIQLEETLPSYDQWLAQSMDNFLKDDEDPSKHPPMPFDGRWESARWWFSEFLASRDSTRLREPRGGETTSPALPGSGMLQALVGIRQGFTPAAELPRMEPELTDSRVKAAVEMMLCNEPESREVRMATGIEMLLDAGFAIFAHPWSNHALEQLSQADRTYLANKLRRSNRGATQDPWSHTQELRTSEYPVLEVLTKREKFVATAAAQGLNNHQIAIDAGVSVRTVEGHLYQIYSKLSLGGRRDLSSLVESSRAGDEAKT